MFHYIGVGNVLLADAHFHGDGEVVHQRNELFEKVFTKRGRMGDGDAVGARQLDLGISTGGLRNLAVAVISQAQGRVAKQRTLLGIRLDAVLEIAHERLVQRGGRTLVQGRQAIHGLFGGLNDYKRFGHDQLPVF
ncbi:hypothetical protein ALQ97_200065 [Pseudomonas savastanoi pv. glycinea]|nr:hypothetical protein ALQ97_200065 [Pseudomonas savastanoi pv. glycinea]